MTTFQKGGKLILNRWIFNICTFSCTMPVKSLHPRRVFAAYSFLRVFFCFAKARLKSRSETKIWTFSVPLLVSVFVCVLSDSSCLQDCQQWVVHWYIIWYFRLHFWILLPVALLGTASATLPVALPGTTSKWKGYSYAFSLRNKLSAEDRSFLHSWKYHLS